MTLRQLSFLVAYWLSIGYSMAEQPTWDVVIRNGKIVDGTGAPWYRADIGIRDGKISKIGRIPESAATSSLDATGLIVAPGFIDMMGQSASSLMEHPETAMNLLTQGITTINCGEGSSAAPLSAQEGAQQGWTTMREYFALLDMQGLPLNVVQTVGHTQVRRIVLGDIDRRPSESELKEMQALVADAMQAGAIGVSTALIYPPAVYAPMEEIAALAEVAGQYGGSYYAHMRNEGDQLLEAIEEALEIGRRGKTPVHIFHLKAAGKQNWGKMQLAIAKIKAARSEGQQVTADIYPYINNGLGIAAFIHPRHFAEGFDRLRVRLDDEGLRAEIRQEMETTSGWENWYRHVGNDWDKVIIGEASDKRYSPHVGKSLAVIANDLHEDPWTVFFALVRSGAFALPQSMTDANKILAMQQEFISFCTDVGPAGKDSSSSHPRAYGSFPRLLSHYVRDLGAISLERAVAQASSVACNDVHVFDRGRITEGLAADLVLFDLAQLADKASFTDPTALSTGVRTVLVNGQIVLKDGQLTEARPGRVLKGMGFDEKTDPSAVRSSQATKTLSSFDEMAEKLLAEHRVPGLAIAVTDQGRLVHAAGYGYGDLSNLQPVAPDSLFRIASLSKPITAVAVLQLVEQGKLKLTDRVLSILSFDEAIEIAGKKFDPRWKDITIEQLLQHRGGWDRDVSFDAMFKSVEFAHLVDVTPPAGKVDVIRAMLSYPLDYDPGLKYAYSNFGYNLLGRVIEKLSDQSYEAYVQQYVLAPLGIHDMRIGASRMDGRQPGEVRYYHPSNSQSVFTKDLGETVPSQYGGWNLEAMDSHGGWLASAVDLARFASALDDPQHCKILNEASIARMHERPAGLAGYDEQGDPKDVYYSLGWQNRVVAQGKENHWHTGSLSGTATIMIRRHDGRNFVALMNSRVSPKSAHLGREIDTKLHEAAAGVARWPSDDFFSQFPKKP